MTVKEFTSCRSCGGNVLEDVLSLGNLCVSDFVDNGGEPDRAPLELVRCRRCGLVQLRHSVDRDRLYRRYHYRSGTNETMVAALNDVVVKAMEKVVVHPGQWVLDVGCNDNTLLDQYPTYVRTVGFEPSDLAVTTGPRHFVVHDYFPPTKYPVVQKNCKIVTAVAVFYDLDAPGAFLEEVKKWLHPQGVFVVQMQDLDAMLEANAFDNLCHEHVTHWTEATLGHLLRRHGLRISHSERVPVNGGSARYFVRWGTDPSDDYVDDASDRRRLREFAGNIQALKQDTLGLLHRLKAEGKTVYGYAASTKFNTLAQFYGLGPDLITAIGERSPHKWGKRTVCTDIPIISEKQLRAAAPDYLFVGAWQFAAAFAERERALLEKGTKLIVPLPVLRVVGVEDADVLKTVAA